MEIILVPKQLPTAILATLEVGNIKPVSVATCVNRPQEYLLEQKSIKNIFYFCRDVSVTWRLGSSDCSVVVRPGGRFASYTSTEGECTLSIQSCRPGDAGCYTCSISNAHGTVSTSCVLTVNGE